MVRADSQHGWRKGSCGDPTGGDEEGNAFKTERDLTNVHIGYDS